MKTALTYWYIFLLILVVATSCKTVIPVETKTEHEKETVTNTETSKAIIDSLMIKISQIKTTKPECDSITNAEIQKLLKQISAIKKSGNNETGFYFDELRQMLIAYAKTGESTNSNKQTKETTKTEKPVVIKYVPKFIQYAAYIGYAAVLFFILWIAFKIFTWKYQITKKIKP